MSEPAVFLLVEDNLDDIFFFKRALARCHANNPLQVVTDGAEAIAYLEGSGRYANRAAFPMPKVLFLDLKLPCIDGFDVLRWLRERDLFRTIHVIILTGSDAGPDVDLANRLGAETFLSKPLRLPDLDRLVRALDEPGDGAPSERPVQSGLGLLVATSAADPVKQQEVQTKNGNTSG